MIELRAGAMPVFASGHLPVIERRHRITGEWHRIWNGSYAFSVAADAAARAEVELSRQLGEPIGLVGRRGRA